MATQNIEKTFPNREGDELFSEVKNALDPYVKKYSLAERVDQDNKRIQVKKTGFEGNLQVEGDKVSLSLDYSPLMPGPVKQKITQGVVSALDEIAKKGT